MGSGRVVFFGTPDICIPFLEILRDFFDLQLIVTQPDAVGGRNRKKKLVPAAKTFAMENDIDYLQPQTLKDEQLKDKMQNLHPDIGVVISYAKFIPGSIFKIPKHKTINVHFSMLPIYRGAAPVQRALENGDQSTGITIFEIVKKMDAGPIYTQKEFVISPTDTTEILWQKLSHEGAEFLRETLDKILKNKIVKKEQDHELATFAPAVKKEESKVDWHLEATQIYNKFRAFTPWPGLSCFAYDKQFKLTDIKVSPLTHKTIPGHVLSMDRKSLKICCGQGSVLEVLEFQPQGKRTMSPFCYCLGNELPERLDGF
jgi:methionyl-tRNA formyltransferase